jgi:hypothetical protein
MALAMMERCEASMSDFEKLSLEGLAARVAVIERSLGLDPDGSEITASGPKPKLPDPGLTLVDLLRSGVFRPQEADVTKSPGTSLGRLIEEGVRLRAMCSIEAESLFSGLSAGRVVG